MGPFGSLLHAYDSKDNDVEIEGLEIDPETGKVSVAKFTLRNNASDPINAFAAQMEQMNEAHRIYGQNMATAFAGLNELAGKLTGALGVLNPAATPTRPKDVAISSDIVGPVLPVPE